MNRQDAKHAKKSFLLSKSAFLTVFGFLGALAVNS